MSDTTHEALVTMESEMNELTSKTVKAVERFFPWGDMEEDETGYWVRYDDFIQGCADAREAAEAERDALAEKLARAVEAERERIADLERRLKFWKHRILRPAMVVAGPSAKETPHD
jgi:hypothetical protein